MLFMIVSQIVILWPQYVMHEVQFLSPVLEDTGIRATLPPES